MKLFIYWIINGDSLSLWSSLSTSMLFFCGNAIKCLWKSIFGNDNHFPRGQICDLGHMKTESCNTFAKDPINTVTPHSVGPERKSQWQWLLRKQWFDCFLVGKVNVYIYVWYHKSTLNFCYQFHTSINRRNFWYTVTNLGIILTYCPQGDAVLSFVNQRHFIYRFQWNDNASETPVIKQVCVLGDTCGPFY